MKNRIILLLIASLSLFLSSCVQDSWTDGTLDYTFSPKTDSYGYFTSNGVYYNSDIYINTYANYINYFNFNRSVVKISGNFYAGDLIDGLEIDIDRVGVYRIPSFAITSNNVDQEITIVDSYYDSSFNSFMAQAFNVMSTYGSHDVIVRGYVLNRNNSPVVNCQVYVDFYNDLDVNVSN